MRADHAASRERDAGGAGKLVDARKYLCGALRPFRPEVWPRCTCAAARSRECHSIENLGLVDMV